MNEVIDPVILEILKESGGVFAWELTKWTAIGISCGALLAILVFFLLRALGAYRLDWAYAKACIILVFVLTLVLSVTLLGFIGFNQGFFLAVERSLEKDKFSNKVLPSIGSTGADLLAYIYITAPLYERVSNQAISGSAPADSEGNSNAQLEEFREGKWELDLNELAKRIKRAKKMFIHDVATQMKGYKGSAPSAFEEGLGDKLFNWISERFVEWIIQEDLESSGLMFWIRAGLSGLEEASHNDPTVSYHELSVVIGEIFVNKGILAPVRGAVRMNQLVLVISLVALFAVPVLIFRITNFVKLRNSPNPADPHPAQEKPNTDS